MKESKEAEKGGGGGSSVKKKVSDVFFSGADV